MLTRTERILLALQAGPMTVKDAMVHLGCEEKEARNALANLQENGRARAERKGRACEYRITETGRQKIEDLQHDQADKTRRTAGLFNVAQRPRFIGGMR